MYDDRQSLLDSIVVYTTTSMFAVTITLPEKLLNKVESDRKDLSRSKYIAILLERGLNCKEGAEQQ